MYCLLRRSGLRERFFSLQDKKMGPPFAPGVGCLALKRLAFFIINHAKILQNMHFDGMVRQGPESRV
jgi:hypothetical protein